MSTMRYSDLEVAHNNPNLHEPAGLEYDYYQADAQTQKEAVSTAFLPPNPDSNAPPEKKRICGLPAKRFWIVAGVLAVLLIAGAIGGGVGGSLASKSSSNADAASAASQNQTTSSSSSAETSASTSSASTTTNPPQTTTTIIGPKYTLARDCPSSNNTLYTVTFGNTPQTFQKTCANTVFVPAAYRYGNVVDQGTTSLEGCINLCANWNVQKAKTIESGKDAVCNAVCWRNSLAGDEFPGRCFGYPYPTENGTTSDGGKVQWGGERKCDSGVWVDQRPL